MEKGHYGKYTGNAKWSMDHAHTKVTKENYKATERDDAAHIDYLKRDVLYDDHHGHSDEKMTADEKHISKLAGDMKYDKKHHGSPMRIDKPVGKSVDKPVSERVDQLSKKFGKPKEVYSTKPRELEVVTFQQSVPSSAKEFFVQPKEQPKEFNHKTYPKNMKDYKSPAEMGHSPLEGHCTGSPNKMESAKQEKYNLMHDNPVAKHASGGSWMSKHSKSAFQMGHSPAEMGHESPAKNLGHGMDDMSPEKGAHREYHLKQRMSKKSKDSINK